MHELFQMFLLGALSGALVGGLLVYRVARWMSK